MLRAMAMKTAAKPTINVLEETIYSDGSGSAGLYEIYGVQMSGITTGAGGVVTVTPISIGTGHRSGRYKQLVSHACYMLEQRLQPLVA